MARGTGVALKSLQLFIRFIEFCCAAIILGIFSYFLATLHNHDLNIDNYARSVEGISGAAVLYTFIGLTLLCFVAGIAFFSIVAILLDLAFVGAFAYVAYQTRGGASSCNGTVNTVYGTGDADGTNSVPNGDGGSTRLPSFRQACQLETACFSVAIVAIAFFLLSALLEVALLRHHKREKAFGPSPANNYTTGSTRHRRHFWQRRHAKRDAALGAGALGVAAHEKHHHPDTLPMHSTPAAVRHSYATDNTAVGNEPVGYNKYGNEVISDGYRTPTRPGTGYNSTTTPAVAAAYDGANSRYGHHNAGYQESGLVGRDEIPASQYGTHSVHDHNYSTTF